MSMKLHYAFVLTLLAAGSVSAQANSLNDLFDGATRAAAPLTSFTPASRTIPNEVGTPVFHIAPKTSLLPRQAEGPLNQDVLLSFLEQHGAALSEVPGVRALSVGLDCLSEGSHRHIVAHKSIIMIIIDATANQDMIRRQMLRKVPQLSQVPFQVFAAQIAPAKAKSFLN